jgi:hypothetical protein
MQNGKAGDYPTKDGSQIDISGTDMVAKSMSFQNRALIMKSLRL